MTAYEDVKRVQNVIYLPERKTLTPMRKLIFSVLLLIPTLGFLWLAIIVAFSFS